MKPIWKKWISKIVGDNTSLLINMTVLGMLDIFITGLAGSYIAVTLSQWPSVVSVGIGFLAIIMLILGALQIIQMARISDQDETQQQILLNLDELSGEITILRQMQ